MCGIFSFISNNNSFEIDVNNITNNLNKIKKRGPDNTQTKLINNVFFGFHRLSINDLSDAGNQPMELNDCYLICNGEIFNHLDIKKKYRFNTKSDSDCEVILHLYNYLVENNCDNFSEYIINELCNELDGEFSFMLYDKNNQYILIARDPYGVRPLFFGYDKDSYMFASELKGIDYKYSNIKQFQPGSYMIINNLNKEIDIENIKSECNDIEKVKFKINKYHEIIIDKLQNFYNEESLLENLNYIFRKSVYKRMMSDKEICSLLSGGLDSSLVASILSQKLGPNKLKTFAIGIKGSPDLKYAKIVADHIKSIHYTIELTEKQFLDAIEEVIIAIESYDTTTVRASVGNYLVSKYIRENTDCKVIFNGDYADEVCGGYKYFKKTSNESEFHNECIRLVNDIHYFDCLRSDRSISNNGLEARVPFADKDFINYYLSIEPKYRMSNNKIEKCMLRKAFENDNLLPDEILWRNKEAFSDGVTDEKRSWYKIIQEYVDTKITDEYFMKNKDKYTHNTPVLKESFYYREIFEKHYLGKSDVIPYFWMPLWSEDTNDPSARTY